MSYKIELTGSEISKKLNLVDTNTTAISSEINRATNAENTLLTNITSHTSSKENPHSVTKDQIGLGNVDNTADADKVVASSNKLTTARTIFGQPFDGTTDVNGDITVDGFIVTPSDPQLVDLDLSSGTLWMDRNVGASNPEDTGLYFAWGGTTGYTTDEVGTVRQFNKKSYEFGTSPTKYNSTDGLTTLETTDDAVLQNIHKYSMPTYLLLLELINETTFTWTTRNGVNGGLFSSKTNSNSIFIPASGRGNDASILFTGNHGYFWSSSLDERSGIDYALCIHFSKNSNELVYIDRYFGMPVRGVATPKEGTGNIFNLPSTSGTLALNDVATTTSNGLMSADDKTQLTLNATNIATNTANIATNTEAIAALEEKTPTMWANVLAVKDTAITVDGQRVELPAYTNVIIKDFKTIALATNTPNPSCIKKFDIHYNGIAKVKSLRWYATYTPTDESESGEYFIRPPKLDVSCMDTSEATSMQYWFYGQWDLKELDVIGFNTSNVTNMSTMFAGCNALTKLDVAYFNTSKVTTFTNMFYNAGSLASINVSAWDVSKAASFRGMFYECSSLTSLDLSGWNTSACHNTSYMFNGCTKLTTIGDVSKCDVSKVENMAGMFAGCGSLTSLDLSGWSPAWATSMYLMFCGCTKLTTIGDVSKWDTHSCRSLTMMFYEAKGLTSIDASGWDTSNVTGDGMWATFFLCANLVSANLSGWNTAKVYTLESFFANCSKLETANLAGFDTTSITGWKSMFHECRMLTDITFGEGFGKATASGLTLDLSMCGISKSYQLTDNTYNTMLTMYDRATNGLPTMTIKFNAKHNLPDGFIAAMTARGYVISQ